MSKIDLSKYGITGTTEIVHNPSYEVLFKEETKPELEGFEKGGIDISLYNIKNQLGAYAVYVFYNYLYEYILMTDDYKEYKERIRKTDEIIFRYIGYARYNFKDKRSVIMMGIMKNRLWRILWIYAKKKGRKRYDGKE